MKKLLLPCLLIASLLIFNGCRRKCEDLMTPPYSGFTSDLLAWMGDSATLDYRMIDFDGDTIFWGHSYGKPTDNVRQITDCVGDPARQQTTRSLEFKYFAPPTREELWVTLRSVDESNFIELKMADALVWYDPFTNTFLPTQTSEGQFNPTGAMLPSYPLRGKTWANVLYIDLQSPLVIYPKFWLAKGWGIIRYENQAGRAWERI